MGTFRGPNDYQSDPGLESRPSESKHSAIVVWDFIRLHVLPHVASLTATGITVIATFGEPSGRVIAALVGLFIFLVVGSGYNIYQFSVKMGSLEANLRDATEDLNQARHRLASLSRFGSSIYESMIIRITNQLNCCGNNERITIYHHNTDSPGVFVARARFSSNPEYRSIGRPIIPASEGFVGEAWAKGKSSCFNLPDPALNNKRSYVSRFKDNRFRQYPISECTLRKLRMPSRCYIAYRLDASIGNPVGVIVLESTDPQGLKRSELEDMFQREGDNLAQALALFPAREPIDAANRGV